LLLLLLIYFYLGLFLISTEEGCPNALTASCGLLMNYNFLDLTYSYPIARAVGALAIGKKKKKKQ
jgi:hypothetical protein